MVESMRFDDFSALGGRDCRLRRSGAEGEVDLPAVLAEVSLRHRQGGHEEFSLLFRAQEAGAPRQGLHAVVFDDGATHEMFLVPVARQNECVTYEACFNRIAV